MLAATQWFRFADALERRRANGLGQAAQQAVTRASHKRIERSARKTGTGPRWGRTRERGMSTAFGRIGDDSVRSSSGVCGAIGDPGSFVAWSPRPAGTWQHAHDGADTPLAQSLAQHAAARMSDVERSGVAKAPRREIAISATAMAMDLIFDTCCSVARTDGAHNPPCAVKGASVERHSLGGAQSVFCNNSSRCPMGS